MMTYQQQSAKIKKIVRVEQYKLLGNVISKHAVVLLTNMINTVTILTIIVTITKISNLLIAITPRQKCLPSGYRK